DGTARRMADDVRAGDAERVHELDDVHRHALDRVGDPAVIALADATVVVQHDIEGLGESRDVIAPIGGVTVEPADEDDGKAAAVPFVIEVAVADRDARHGWRRPGAVERIRVVNIPPTEMSNSALSGTAMHAPRPAGPVLPRA